MVEKRPARKAPVKKAVAKKVVAKKVVAKKAAPRKRPEPPPPAPAAPSRRGISVFGLRVTGAGVRDTVLFAAGLGGVAYETIFTAQDRPTLLLLFAAMMGLPAFLRTDENRRSQ